MLYTVENTSAVGQPMHVFLDRNLMYYVMEADTSGGYIIVADTDANGDILLDGHEIKTNRLTGVVTVEPMD